MIENQTALNELLNFTTQNEQFLPQDHENTHTGAKPYGCHQCDYRCANHANLNKHFRQKHGMDSLKNVHFRNELLINYKIAGFTRKTQYSYHMMPWGLEMKREVTYSKVDKNNKNNKNKS